MEKKIGDEVFVHGYIDEIRGRTVIVRNDGGYFGTDRDEVFEITECKYCKYSEVHGLDLFCKYWHKYTYFDGFCHFADKIEENINVEESVEVRKLTKEDVNHE